MEDQTRILMGFVPPKYRGMFKGLLAGKDTLEVIVKLDTPWWFVKSWDTLTFPEASSKLPHWHIPAEQCTQAQLADKMYVYGNTLIFLENKGPNGWMKTKATIVTLDQGKIKYELEEKGDK